MPPATPEALQARREGYATLMTHEAWWRDHQQWLQERGYMLRRRYRPGWVPSWEGTKDESPYNCEDSVLALREAMMDATRISDGKIVMLKKLDPEYDPDQLAISLLFSTEPLVSHPRNHCVPIYEVLAVPDYDGMHILVMPLLRTFNDPIFKTVGEAVGCFTQVFEALQFMHQCHVAHRDCMDLNIMMDTGMFPKLFHPQMPLKPLDMKTRHPRSYTRTRRPPKYFLIDFGLSGIYDPAKGPTTAMPVLSGDRTVPEFQNRMDRPHEVYPTDIYYIGNMIRECFLQKYGGVEFIEPLVNDMVQDDPMKRPNIDEVIERFADIRKTLSWRKLRSRLVDKEMQVGSIGKFFTVTGHVLRTIGYVVTFRPAVPLP